MARKRKKRKKYKSFVRLKKLKCFSEVDVRLRCGASPEKVASFIQQEMNEYEDVKWVSLVRQLYKYKKSIPVTQVLSPTYIDRAVKQIEMYIDIANDEAKLIQYQKIRLAYYGQREEVMNVPIHEQSRNIELLANLLKQHRDTLIELGIVKRQPIEIEERVAGRLELEHKHKLSPQETQRVTSEARKLLKLLKGGKDERERNTA
ncbi:MAG: hypothetical protein AB1401_00405 [Thermodesulfobacteriota bacterium]